MRRKRTAEIPMEMQKVYERLESWRKGRRGRSRIPEPLWAAAAAVAREHGVNRTSKVLSLEFNKLKRLSAAGKANKTRATLPALRFVELVAAAGVGVSECVIEVEGRHGTMRIHWKGITASDVAQLSRLLMEPA